ncbi:MAG: cyanophycin synthetase [Actinomycetota bacterium]|jgi:dihydrofolate synthase/folylpolyglutamate synthase|nr:cyanophycin synthetase [Actinomycetota bacterium]
MKNNNFKEACRYLDGTLVFGIKPGLERIKKFLQLSNHPERKTDFIHIVGTNGKTSTAKMTASILNHHGLKSGYYISPHIHSYTERIAFGGKEISENDFSTIFFEIFPFIEKVNSANIDGSMTQFEILTSMMFYLCAKENLDVMVMEAGMGGRWDATNSADAKVVGLTGVSLEHTQILGRTIRQITSEKSEVIKNNCLIASNSTCSKVNNILFNKSIQTHSMLYIYKKDFKILKVITESIEGAELSLKGIYNDYDNIFIPLAGDYQKKNLLLSLVLSELYLGTVSLKVEQEKVNEALKKTNITGRFQVIKRKPLFIADASHNPEGIKNFVKNIDKYFPDRKKIIIFSVLKDKDYKKMIEEIIKIADTLIISSSLTDRSLSVKEVKKNALDIISVLKIKNKKYPEKIIAIDNIENSMKYALNLAKKDDIISLTGSITNLEFVKTI